MIEIFQRLLHMPTFSSNIQLHSKEIHVTYSIALRAAEQFARCFGVHDISCKYTISLSEDYLSLPCTSDSLHYQTVTLI